MKYVVISLLLFSGPLLTHEVEELKGAEQPLRYVDFNGRWIGEVTLKMGDQLEELPAEWALGHCDWDRPVMQFTMSGGRVVNCFSNGRDIRPMEQIKPDK